jgi:monoterpene epsilon-lactone hydrolase
MTSNEMKAILALAENLSPVSADRIEDRRANTSAALHGPLSEGTVAEDRPLGGRPALWIQPLDKRAAEGHIILYLHGGLFEVGSPSDYQAFCSRLALRLGATVVVVDYRLAPEHPFPGAVDDTVAAYRELIHLGRPCTNTALVGDSAGGGLVMSCLIALHRGQLPQPAAAAAISPWADLTSNPESRRRCAESDPFLTIEMLQRAADQYLGDADPRDPLASPSLATKRDLSGLAPILLQAAGNEILVDDSCSLADRIIKAGGSASLEVTGEAFHVWHVAGDTVPEARHAMDSLCHFISARWAVPGLSDCEIQTAATTSSNPS